MNNARLYLVTVRKSKTPPSDFEDVLARFAKEVEGNPDAKILDRSHRSRVRIQASEEAISRLRSQFGDQLIIEPDAELNLLKS